MMQQLRQMTQQLRRAEAAKEEAEYELQHQHLWFSATQQEADKAREAEATNNPLIKGAE